MSLVWLARVYSRQYAREAKYANGGDQQLRMYDKSLRVEDKCTIPVYSYTRTVRLAGYSLWSPCSQGKMIDLLRLYQFSRNFHAWKSSNPISVAFVLRTRKTTIFIGRHVPKLNTILYFHLAQPDYCAGSLATSWPIASPNRTRHTKPNRQHK